MRLSPIQRGRPRALATRCAARLSSIRKRTREEAGGLPFAPIQAGAWTNSLFHVGGPSGWWDERREGQRDRRHRDERTEGVEARGSEPGSSQAPRHQFPPFPPHQGRGTKELRGLRRGADGGAQVLRAPSERCCAAG